MNRLDALKIFVSLAETLHFKETATRLAVSPQVVTRIINELEQELGETLFQRSTRQVKLSDFGQAFLPQAIDVLEQTEQLFTTHKNANHDTKMKGTVRIAVPKMALMSEVLDEFCKRLTDFPDLRIDWRSDLELVDVVDTQIDVGIRFGKPEDNRLIVKKVGSAEDGIFATPDCLNRFGTPKNWQDLQKNYPLATLLNPHTGKAWAWYLSGDCQFAPSKTRFMSSDLNDQLISVLNGQGIGCLPRLMCRDYVASGELVELFPNLPRQKWDAYVYRPMRSVTHPRVKWAFDVLVEILGEKLQAV